MAERKRIRTNDPEGLRGRVLDAAAGLFQARGYHATGMAEIFKAAGVTSGGLHHHFPTKKAIGLAVLKERVAPEVDATWIAPLAREGSTARAIEAVFGRIGEGLDAAGRVQGCPLNNLALELSLADPDFRAGIAEVFAAWRAALAEQLRRDCVERRVGDLDPEATAAFIVAAYSGAMAMAKAEQSSRPLAETGRQLVRMLKA